jgi:hypothetical protein
MLPALPAAGPEPAAQQHHSSRQHHSSTPPLLQQSWHKTHRRHGRLSTQQKRQGNSLSCRDALTCAAQPQPAPHQCCCQCRVQGPKQLRCCHHLSLAERHAIQAQQRRKPAAAPSTSRRVRPQVADAGSNSSSSIVRSCLMREVVYKRQGHMREVVYKRQGHMREVVYKRQGHMREVVYKRQGHTLSSTVHENR